MLALIDGDVLAYRIGFTTQNDPEWVARARLKEMIGGILSDVSADDYQIYLSDSKQNWRLEYFPQYKANRTQPKPIHLTYLQNLLVEEWDAEVAFGQEADDALGIWQTVTSIICSIDKDLLQIPGWHYNFVKKEIKQITPEEGLYRFYEQTLTGDTTDNITSKEGLSCRGIGPKKAHKLLEGCESERDYFETCYQSYHRQWKDDFTPDEIDKKFLTTGRVIKIRTEENQIWNFPYDIADLGVDQKQLLSETLNKD